MVELIAELESAGHSVTMMKQKWVLLRKLSKEYVVNVEAIIAVKHTYNRAVAKLIVWEAGMQVSEKSTDQALVTRTKGESRK